MAIHSLNESGHPITKEGVAAPPPPHRRPVLGIVIFVVFVFLVSGVVLYFTFAPTLCPVLCRAQEDVVTAPANAEICFLASAGPVKKGAVVARLLIRPDTGGAFLEQMHRFQDRMRKLDSEEASLNAILTREEKELEMLSGDLTLAKADVELAVYNQKHTASLQDSQKKRTETAARLFHLEALRHSDFIHAEEQLAVAEGEARKADLQLRSARLRFDLLQKNYTSAQTELAATRAATAKKHNENARFRAQLRDVMACFEIVPSGVKVKFKAARDGTICNTMLRDGDRVASGDVVVRIFSDDSMGIEVFIPEELAPQASRASSFQISLGGKTFSAQVSMLSSRLEPLPNPLRATARKPEQLYLRAYVKVPRETADGLICGQTGTALMR